MGLEYYKVDSISKPQASSNGSGMYLEFLLRRAPLAQPRGTGVLVWREFVFFHGQLK